MVERGPGPEHEVSCCSPGAPVDLLELLTHKVSRQGSNGNRLADLTSRKKKVPALGGLLELFETVDKLEELRPHIPVDQVTRLIAGRLPGSACQMSASVHSDRIRSITCLVSRAMATSSWRRSPSGPSHRHLSSTVAFTSYVFGAVAGSAPSAVVNTSNHTDCILIPS
jgi:hypothetical protein